MRLAGTKQAVQIAYEWSEPNFKYPGGRLVGVFINPNWGMPRPAPNGLWTLDERQYIRKYIDSLGHS
jgi:hypothetical protein